MVVISRLNFTKYLYDVRVAGGAAENLMPLPRKTDERECDILILHRDYGLMTTEIKSVGGKQHFRESVVTDQDQVIVSKVKDAVGQLNKQCDTLNYLVSDVAVRVSKTLVLPNITSDQLLRALNTDPAATQVSSVFVWDKA